MLSRDRFQNFRDLMQVYEEGRNFVIEQTEGRGDNFLIAAIHGGWIEPCTDDIARDIATDDHGLYLFKGDTPDLHITGDLFDEPRFLAQASRYDHVVTIHGCQDKWGDEIFIGGMHESLMQSLVRSFNDMGVPASLMGHIFLACTPHNACNKGRAGAGAQIEILKSMRDDPAMREKIVTAVRKTLEQF